MPQPSQRLELKQSQSLVMTPQLQQSIKILQLSSIELYSYINQEIEQNPLLTKEETLAQETSIESEGQEETPAPERDEAFSWEGEEGYSAAVYERDSQPMDYSGNGGHTDFNMEDRHSEELSLRDFVTDQINLDITDQKDRIIALHLTDMLDDNGYLKEDIALLAQQLGCELEDVERVLIQLQRFDPPGVFARSIAECLALQLKDKNRYDPAMEALLANLELLAKGEVQALQKICGVNQEDMQEMIHELRQLNPKPGRNFATDVVQSIQPDVFLRKNHEQKWLVELNHDTLPKVLLNRRYHAEIEQKPLTKDEKKYIADQLQTANWLIKALDQRAQTILKVATEIVRQQQDFFDYGIRYLKPLTLAEIAEAIEMHESTVSRVTTNKYIATHFGLYEMKYFFSSSIGCSEGDGQFSSKTIRFMIKELIQKEEPNAILSDEAIAEMLKEKNIDIARRTVAKYREEMNIPTSAVRKREKRVR